MGESKYTKKFTTKGTWSLLRDRQPPQTWCNGVCFKHATPKYSFLTWIAAHNRLKTGDRMRLWNRGLRTDCILCGNQEELRNHLFFCFKFSGQIWETLALGLLGNAFTTNWEDLMSTLVDTSYDKLKFFLFQYPFKAKVYHIWREKNNRCHGESSISAPQLSRTVDKNICNRISSIRPDHKFHQEGLLRWFEYTRSNN